VTTKIDGNQSRIVGTLRAAGATVTILAGCGLPGVPDLLIGYQGYNLLMEIKNKNGFNRLSPVQKDWINRWAGQVAVVYNEQEALNVLYTLLE
jgi:hypothetical protein